MRSPSFDKMGRTRPLRTNMQSVSSATSAGAKAKKNSMSREAYLRRLSAGIDVRVPVGRKTQLAVDDTTGSEKRV